MHGSWKGFLRLLNKWTFELRRLTQPQHAGAVLSAEDLTPQQEGGRPANAGGYILRYDYVHR